MNERIRKTTTTTTTSFPGKRTHVGEAMPTSRVAPGCTDPGLGPPAQVPVQVSGSPAGARREPRESAQGGTAQPDGPAAAAAAAAAAAQSAAA
jgi:hypothetical protein